MTPTNQTLVKFLETIAGNQPGYLALFDLTAKSHANFPTNDLESAAEFAEHCSRLGHQVYGRANVQGSSTGTTAATVSAMTILTLDFDIAGPGHKTERRLPSSYDDVFALLRKADTPLPTQLLKTGGGLFALWALEHPFMIGSEADRARAKELSRRFQGRLAQVAKSMGFHIDATFDLVRACRLPGTRNWKPVYGQSGAPVEIYQ